MSISAASLGVTGRVARYTRLLVAAILVASLFAGFACSSQPAQPTDRVYRLENELMCPVCPGETIYQSQVQIARDMRTLVQQKVQAGETDAQIKQYFVNRYGVGILASPPTKGSTLWAWVFPPAGLAVAAVGLLLIMRAMRSSRSTDRASAETTEADLAPYMEAVEAEFARSNPAKRPRQGDQADHSEHMQGS